jgi:hypothetical protein
MGTLQGPTGLQHGERPEGPTMQPAPPSQVDQRSPMARRIDGQSGRGEMCTQLDKWVPYDNAIETTT